MRRTYLNLPELRRRLKITWRPSEAELDADHYLVERFANESGRGIADRYQ